MAQDQDYGPATGLINDYKSGIAKLQGWLGDAPKPAPERKDEPLPDAWLKSNDIATKQALDEGKTVVKKAVPKKNIKPVNKPFATKAAPRKRG